MSTPTLDVDALVETAKQIYHQSLADQFDLKITDKWFGPSERIAVEAVVRQLVPLIVAQLQGEPVQLELFDTDSLLVGA